MNSLMENVKLTRVSDAVAAGQTAINASSVDMKGFEAVTFVVAWGAITAGGVQSVKLQQSDDDTNWADLEGSAVDIADDDDNKLAYLELHNPRERYVRAVVSRATQNSAIDGIIALQSGPKLAPVTHDSTTVADGEIHHAPAEGTA